jgi:D-alanine--poly(phosphoribitol) ligase subunit 2
MKDSILKLIQDISGKSEVPADDESLFDSGYLDSFALTDLVTALEEKFGFKAPDSDVNPRKFETVEKIVSYVEGHQ